MATVTREDLIPSLIANTNMQKMFVDGVHTGYSIEAIDGYGLHDKDSDVQADGIVVIEPIICFGVGSMTVRKDYDFDNVVNGTYNGVNGVIQVQKIGAKKLFAIPLSEVGANNISGVEKGKNAQTEEEKIE